MDVEKAIKKRKSVRKFKDKKPKWRDIVECIDLARYAPMAGNNLTVRFLIVDNSEQIEKIADACQQPWIAEAPYVVIFCSDPRRLINAYGEENGHKYSHQQSGAAIENFLLGIESKGLASCWIGFFEKNMIKKEFHIPEEVNIEAIFPVGYESGTKYAKKAKCDLDTCLYFHKFGNKKMKVPNRVD